MSITESEFWQDRAIQDTYNVGVFRKRIAECRGLNYAVLDSAIRKIWKEKIDESDYKDSFVNITTEELKEATTLSRRQQDFVIKKMIEDGVIIVEKRGMPQKRYFKVIGTV